MEPPIPCRIRRYQRAKSKFHQVLRYSPFFYESTSFLDVLGWTWDFFFLNLIGKCQVCTFAKLGNSHFRTEPRLSLTIQLNSTSTLLELGMRESIHALTDLLSTVHYVQYTTYFRLLLSFPVDKALEQNRKSTKV